VSACRCRRFDRSALSPLFLLLLMALTIGLPRCLRAQQIARATTAVAAGWSGTAGLIGVEMVRRAPPGRASLGLAVGAGLAGAGARVNLSLVGQPSDTAGGRVPYVSVGIDAIRAILFSAPHRAASMEFGTQRWPDRRGGTYYDLGGGLAVVADSETGPPFVSPTLRALIGRAF